MNNKFKLIILAVIGIFILTACNGSSSNGQQIDANTVPPVDGDISLDSAAPGAASGLIAMVTGGAETELGEQAALWLLDEVSGGKFPPNQSATLLSNINNQLSSIQSNLSGMNTELTEIYNTINTDQAANQNNIITSYEAQISTYNYKIANYIKIPENFTNVKIKNTYLQITQAELATAESAFLFQSSTPFESSILQAMATANAQKSLGSFSGLDTLGQELSCDNTNQYSTSNPTLHGSPTITLSGGSCALIAALNAQLNNFNTIQLQPGQNAFYVYTSFSALLDLTYLQMVNALTQEYAVDQIRAYLGQHKNSVVKVPLYVADPGSYQSALADITLAYNSRLSYLNTIFTEAKESAFNYITTLAPAVNSSSLQTQCGITPQNIISAVPANVDISQASKQYYWDGNTLTATCNLNGSQITTATPVATMCLNPNLQAINGYISCGSSLKNYQISESYGSFFDYASNTSLPLLFSITNTPNNESQNYVIPNYGGAVFAQFYSFWSTGTLNISFDRSIVQSNLYKIQNNNVDGGTQTFNSITSTSYAISLTPNCMDFPLFQSLPIQVQRYGTQCQHGIMAMINDGTHIYLLGAGSIENYGSDNQGFMTLGCIPDDPSCQIGNFPNPNNSSEDYNALVYRNGDVITMYNLYAKGHYHGDYFIQTYYNGAAAQQIPDIVNAVSW